MKKVLIITYYWPPSGGAGVQRWLKFAKYLPEFGYEVHVLTVRPDRATYPQRDESLQTQVPKNVTVHCTNATNPFAIYSVFGKGAPSSGFANDDVSGIKGLIKKLARFVRGNVFIPDPRKGWNRFAIEKANELIDTLAIETVITTSPPHSTQLIGLELKKRKNIRWIADMRDPWTKIYYVSELLQTKWAQKKNGSLERQVLENADKIVTVSGNLADEFCELAPRLKRENVKVIPNGFDEDDFHLNFSLERQFTIGYMGTITEQYDISSLLKAIGSGNLDAGFRFIGDVQAGMRNRLGEVASRCEFTGYLNHDKAIEKAASCSILLLVIPKVEANKGILTGKIFEYLALKRPILAIGPVDGDAARILNETGAGKMFDYADVHGISKFLRERVRQFQAGEQHSEALGIHKYSRKGLTDQLVQILEKSV
ncbi:MAG: glycosyltransferase family 4 protein [Flavobacteriales bacterium]|nr:glycosyltransferase family 4 protein [Flavobacteriales bacterium]